MYLPTRWERRANINVLLASNLARTLGGEANERGIIEMLEVV